LESVFKLVYVQQKEFDKALFKKSHLQTQSRIVDQYQIWDNWLSKTEMRKLPKEILGFVLQNTQDLELLIQANSYLVTMKIEKQQKRLCSHQHRIRRDVETI
jgi:hypothetical protein